MGDAKLINVACRGIILDGEGNVLLVRRADNGRWVMPAGAMELDESVLDALNREMREETGLEVEEAELVAVYSDPERYSYRSWGCDSQMLAFVFAVTRRSGELVRQTPETVDAAFFDPDDLPEDVPALYIETIEDLKAYRRTGKVIVK
ncbi:MAG: NUDIX hydrolase [Thermobacillus sp.]|uniref:NUDIX domain-containing protein n=1 Tax=Thermobacillus sp. TaxID=2108467 RepID=UPI000E36DA8C|nr:NUDIX domain-containing protein [Thermobacillus sp.]REK56587.1 MAG: NUDIX hydrolase [Thermobacillus sp.]